MQVDTALPADWVRPARSDFRVESRRKEIKQGAVDYELLADSFAA